MPYLIINVNPTISKSLSPVGETQRLKRLEKIIETSSLALLNEARLLFLLLLAPLQVRSQPTQLLHLSHEEGEQVFHLPDQLRT